MFSDKKLDVLAYENAPSTYRKPFDETTEEISVKVKDGIVEIVQVQLTGNAAHLREAVKTHYRRRSTSYGPFQRHY